MARHFTVVNNYFRTVYGIPINVFIIQVFEDKKKLFYNISAIIFEYFPELIKLVDILQCIQSEENGGTGLWKRRINITNSWNFIHNRLSFRCLLRDFFSLSLKSFKRCNNRIVVQNTSLFRGLPFSQGSYRLPRQKICNYRTHCNFVEVSTKAVIMRRFVITCIFISKKFCIRKFF